MEIINISKKISFNFIIKKFYEAGIVLLGWEVKSIKNFYGINLVGSYIIFKNFELWLCKSFISGNNFCDTSRDRKILLHKKELFYLSNLVKLPGYTILPSRLYLKNNFIKVEICLCVGKKNYLKKIYDKNKKLNVLGAEFYF